MKSKNHFPVLLLAAIMPGLFMQCGTKTEVQEHNAFTETDSLTEIYLVLQDSLHDTWSKMLSDDNEKLKAMKNLVHEMKIGTPYTPEKLAALEERIDQLANIRYTLKTMHNADVVEEYDFASNSLITELISMAESLSSFSYNTTIQKLVEDIRSADLRVDGYREEYDSAAMAYNRFIEQHAESLKDVTEDDSVIKKNLFSAEADGLR